MSKAKSRIAFNRYFEGFEYNHGSRPENIYERRYSHKSLEYYMYYAFLAGVRWQKSAKQDKI